MAFYTRSIKVPTFGQGTYEITAQVEKILAESGFDQGVVTVFCRHTSASLVLTENADPSARSDLENWLSRRVPENDPNFEHNLEGSDDMPAHIKTALTSTSETIPFVDGHLMLGEWQGIFLWEHRHVNHERSVVICVNGERGGASA